MRAVILGLLGAAAVCGFTYFNDSVMHQTMFVGNNMPLSVYGGLVLFVLTFNPLLLVLGRVRSPPVAGVLAGVMAGVVTAVVAGPLVGLVAGLSAGLKTALVAGPLVGLVTGVVTAVAAALTDESAPKRSGALIDGFVGALAGGLTGAAVAGLAAGPLAACLSGLASGVASGLAAARISLSGRELAVVLALTLAACCIPGSGLLRTFTSGLIMPHHFNRTETGWKENRITEQLPAEMLAGAGPIIENEDILDPRGLSAWLVFQDEEEGEGTGRSRSPARRLWARLSETDREALRAGLERALAGPDERWRPKADRALDTALEEREKRRRDQLALRSELLRKVAEEWRQEEQQQEGEQAEQGERALQPLSPADIDALRDAIARALSPPTAESPSSLETVRSLDAMMAEKGFSPSESAGVAAVVAGALSEAEAPARAAAARALNGLLEGLDLYSAVDFEGVTLPKKAEELLGYAGLRAHRGPVPAAAPERSGQVLTDEDVRKLNRHLIDSSFPDGVIRTLVAKEDTAVNGFVQGLSVGEKHIAFGEVPWGAWTRTLSFWLPLILVLWIGLIALSVVVHRQWAKHEQLPYPIAAFADALLPASARLSSGPAMGGTAVGRVFKNRLFWIGAAGVLFIHLNNYAFTWNPDLVKIPTSIECWSLQDLFPNLRKGGGWFAFHPRVFFTVVAFAYFLATDVSLSLGIGPYVYCWIVGILAGYGVAVGGGSYLAPNYQRMQLFGAYLGIFITLVYTGRYYYANVFRKACFLRPREEVERHSVWSARVFLATQVILVAHLAATGLDWQLAALYVLGVVMIFLVMARIAAETGLFFIQPYWAPCLIMAGLFGPSALGPRTMLFMSVLTTVFLIDPRESLMPFVVNSFKLLDLRKVKIGRTAVLCGAAVVVGLVVGLAVTLYFQYDRGANMDDKWANDSVPKFAFNEAVRAKDRLTAQGNLEEAESVSGFGRLRHLTTGGGMIVAFALGLVLTLGFVVARWRLPKWPLHPVMFLIWSTYPGKVFAFSFVLGWFIKAVVVKYGGEGVFRKLKPLMFGLIAGDMLGGIIPTVIGVFYYLFTSGVLPKSFDVMPG